MTLYPKWKPDAHPADHLLFDLGYSYGVLMQTQQLLSEIRPALETGSVTARIDDLLAAMESLKKGRMQIRNEIYDAAEEAAKRAERQ